MRYSVYVNIRVLMVHSDSPPDKANFRRSPPGTFLNQHGRNNLIVESTVVAMDCIKKMSFIFCLSSMIIAQCSYGEKSYRERETLITDVAGFFQEIDKDKNNYVSIEELENSSNQRFNYVELLIIWSLIENYDYIISLSDDEYFFESNGLSLNSIKVYISDILNDKDIRFLLYKMKLLSYGLMPLGVDSIDYQYIHQQQIGDCGLIASITSLAYSRPADIYNMLSQNEDGSFNVNLPSHRNIKVAPSIEILYKGATASYKGFWPLILEITILKLISDESFTISKYFSKSISYLKDNIYHAVLKNPQGKLSRRNYEIDYFLNEITARKAISILTGNPTGHWRIYMSTSNEIRKKLYELTYYKKISVASLYSSHYKFLCLIKLDLPILPINYCYKNLIPPYRNLPNHHCYSILFYDTESDTVVLRNPWGHEEPSDPETHLPIDGRDDGIFKMKLDSFMQVFDMIEFEE